MHIFKTSKWSDWSPCTTSCGPGIQTRVRILLVISEDKQRCADKVKLFDERPCPNQQDCNFNFSTKKGRMSYILKIPFELVVKNI
jgi:hypothetical protein